MTIQASGAITIQDIEDELGGVGSISLSEFYGEGDPALPASGEIAMSDFYGVSYIFDLTMGSRAAGIERGYSTGTDGGSPIGTASRTTPFVAGATLVSAIYRNGFNSWFVRLDGNLASSAFTSVEPHAGTVLLTSAATHSYDATYDYTEWEWTSVGFSWLTGAEEMIFIW